MQQAMTYPEVDAERLPDSWKTSVPKRWGHSLHTVCSRTCSFPPRLAHYFIERYSKRGDTVFDMYSGKGTAPLEACLLGRRGIGNDICPDAFALTYAKTHPPAKLSFFRYIESIRRRLKKVSTSNVPSNVKLYFERSTLEQILALQEMIQSHLNDVDKSRRNFDNAMFLQALMLGILHGRTRFSLSLPLPHSFAMSPSYVRKKVEKEPTKFVAPKRNVIECVKIKANYVFKDPLPATFRRGAAYLMNAADVNLNETADMILTSPPYFTAHTYAWDNWLRLWFLGYDFREVASRLLHTDREDVYLSHFTKVLKASYNLLNENTRCFIVVGDVKGHVPTAYLLADLVEKSMDIGFTVHRIINDAIDQRCKYLYGDNSHAGIQKDRILELHKGEPSEPSTVVWTLGNQSRFLSATETGIC